MTFAAEKAKPNSDRFMLVKITPARYVSEALVSQGGGVYSLGWTYHVEKVQRNGHDLTRSDAAANNDEWSWDGSTLSVKLASAPSASNVIVVFYSLFYTSGQYRIATADPEDSGTEELHWEPRLENEPTVKQSIKDIISGTLSTAITNIRLINSDNEFQKYLTDDDSFFEKTVKCWICINGVTNIQKAFEGRIKSLSIGKHSVTLTTYDIFSLLDQPALMGDTAEEAYWIRQLGSFPNMYSRDSGLPIKYVLAPATRYTETAIDGALSTSAAFKMVVRDSLERAVCTNYSAEISTSNNREWGICRFGSAGPRSLSFGNVAAIYQESDSAFDFYISVLFVRITGQHNLRVGDTFKISRTSPSAQDFVLVIEDQPFTFNPGGGTQTYHYALLHLGAGSSAPVVTPAWTFHSHSAPAIFIRERSSDQLTPMFYERDYTVTTTTTSSGNKYQKITFKNALETEPDGGIDPGADEVLWRHGAAGGLLHGEALKDLCLRAGLSVNSASFAAGSSALPINTSFTIPQFDEQDFASYRKYAEEICKSTMGIIFANNNFDLEYQLLAAPASNGARVNADRYLSDSLAIDVDYQDIVTQLVAYNPHNSSEAALDAEKSPSETVTSAVAEHLHGVKNTVRFRHVLETITDRIGAIFDIMRHRRAIYRFSTTTDNIDSEISDDLLLESPQLLGGIVARDLKIITLDKSAERVEVEATDLLDI